jgi:hypothetical protein
MYDNVSRLVREVQEDCEEDIRVHTYNLNSSLLRGVSELKDKKLAGFSDGDVPDFRIRCFVYKDGRKIGDVTFPVQKHETRTHNNLKLDTPINYGEQDGRHDIISFIVKCRAGWKKQNESDDVDDRVKHVSHEYVVTTDTASIFREMENNDGKMEIPVKSNTMLKIVLKKTNRRHTINSFGLRADDTFIRPCVPNHYEDLWTYMKFMFL